MVAIEASVSNDADIEALGCQIPRLYSTAEKRNRFRVEKLFNVHCVVVCDEVNNGESLLKLATDNVYPNERCEDSACLWMTVGPDRYSMFVCETSLHDAFSRKSPPNVVIFAIVTDSQEQGSAAIDHIRKIIDAPWKPRLPVVLLGYKTQKAKGRNTDATLVKELAALSYDLNAYRCLDCTAINKPTIRTILAMALLAARPYISEFRSLNQLKFDDDEFQSVVPVSVSLPDMSEHKRRQSESIKKRLTRVLSRGRPITRFCHIQ